MNNTIKIKKHVAVFAFPFATHAGLLLGLLRRLAKSLPNVTFSFFTTAKSMASLFSDKSPTELNIKPFDVPDGIPEGYVFSGRPQEDIDLFLNVASDNFRNGLVVAEEVVGEKVSCIIADAFLWFSGEISAEIGCCWVPVWTSGAGSLSMHVYTELIRQTLGVQGLAGREDEILEFIPGFSEVRLGDLPSGVVSGNLESPFSVMLYKMGQILHRADALPINSFEELDPPLINNLKSKFKNVLNVGPFNLTSPTPFATNISDIHGCIPWLDKQRSGSVVYIGFGTVATPSPPEIKALAEALRSTKTPFLWSLKDNMKSHLPEELLDGSNYKFGKIVPWAPQVKVLEHNSIGVFINHCGWNSVLESIAAGVPIICRPFFGDHQLNSWMVEKVWQIGMRIEGGVFTKDVTMRALEVFFSNGKGKKYKEQVVGYKKLAFEAVGPNGSSTKGFQDLVEVITKCM